MVASMFWKHWDTVRFCGWRQDTGINSVWLECIVWGDEVVGSNPTFPTNTVNRITTVYTL